MKNIKIIMATAVLLSSILAASASAQMGRGPVGMKMGHGGMGMAMKHDGPMAMWNTRHVMYAIDQLGLDDKQIGDVRTVLKKFQKEMIQKRADIEIAHVELGDILSQDPVDIKIAEAKVKQIGSMQTEAFMMHIQSVEDIKSKLTPGQRKKFVSIMAMGAMGCPMMPGHPGMGPDNAPAPPVKGKVSKAAPHS
jgi:Spy/CpxP family protein refolding chaperone